MSEKKIEEFIFIKRDKTDADVKSKRLAVYATAAVLLVCAIAVICVFIFRIPKIDLYENVEVTFAGISPDAYIIIQNKWEDEYLKELQFTADKATGIEKDDIITVTCQAAAEELKEHGYRADSLTAEYKADRLNTYADSSEQLDKQLLADITKECMDTIVSETDDTTFRMFYKATNDTGYLHEINNEKAEDVKLLRTLFLTKENELEADANNYLFLTFEANILNDNISMPVYFIFTYVDGYITPDGTFAVDADRTKERYRCSTDLKELYADVIGIHEGKYDFTEIVQ